MKLSNATYMLLGLSLLWGCGEDRNISKLQKSQVAFDEASTFFAEENYGQALPRIESAINTGGLSADQLTSALLIRSRCYAASGELDKAQQDLEMAEQGSPEASSLEIAKGYLLQKQGKEAESRVAYQTALEINPSANIPNK